MNTLHGMKIIESRFLEQDGEPYEARRTWRARLFTLPWRPWKATYTVVPKVPYKGAVQMDANTLAMHPDTLRLMRNQLEVPRS